MNVGETGKVALLTTRHPDYDTEANRIVFGAFKIVERSGGSDGKILLKGKRKSSIRLPEAAALSLRYWRFKTYPKSGVPDWRMGLFRSVSDQEVSNFLWALSPYLQNAQDRRSLESLLECCGNLERDVEGENSDIELPGADPRTKYGSVGEGQRHRQLKEFIKENPEILELGPGKGTVEHSFVTGDRVDVVVDLASGESCVVEVEVEGQSTLVGAHQALKYRALRAGQLDQTKQPHAFLVAYSIPKNVKKFCKRHGVRALEVAPS